MDIFLGFLPDGQWVHLEKEEINRAFSEKCPTESDLFNLALRKSRGEVLSPLPSIYCLKS